MKIKETPGVKSNNLGANWGVPCFECEYEDIPGSEREGLPAARFFVCRLPIEDYPEFEIPPDALISGPFGAYMKVEKDSVLLCAVLRSMRSAIRYVVAETEDFLLRNEGRIESCRPVWKGGKNNEDKKNRKDC
jgi:hypothetical protein